MTQAETENPPPFEIDLNPEPPKWFPWDPENAVPFQSVERGEGNGERRLSEELSMLGYDSIRLGQNGSYDLDTSLGGIEVKEPDSGGRIVTAADGYASLSWLVEECSMVLRMFRVSGIDLDDETFLDHIEAAREALSSGRLSIDTIGVIAAVVEMLSAFYSDRPSSLAGSRACTDPDPTALEWIVDPTLFIADSIVFPSRSLSKDVDAVGLVCKEGYTLVRRRDLDALFIFRDAARNGRPRFSSKVALPGYRKESIKRRSRANRDDKILVIDKVFNNLKEEK